MPKGRSFGSVDYLMVIVLALVLGRGRQTEIADLRHDPAAVLALGLRGVPSQPSLSRFFAACSYRVFERLARMNGELVARLRKGYRSATIDLDGHVISTRGEPKGADFGYNPKRKGARSYFALFGFLAEGRDMLYSLLLPGSRASVSAKDATRIYRASRRAVPSSVRRLRADSAFFSQAFFRRLERDRVTYFVAAAGSGPLRPKVWALRYRRLDSQWAVAEFEHQCGTWDTSRRMVVIRERLARDNRGSQQGRLRSSNGRRTPSAHHPPPHPGALCPTKRPYE